MKSFLLAIAVLVLIQVNLSLAGGRCRLSNDHRNYTCEGFRIRDYSVSPNTRKQILRAWFTNCGEPHIAKEALNFPNLENLTLSCNIQNFHENAFRNLNHLQILNLGNNTISTLPDNLFQSLGELQMLNLSNNNFDELTKTMFDGLSNLKQLNLSHNKISKLHFKALDKMTKLEELYLSNNQIGLIPNIFFNKLKKLLLVDLSYNNLQSTNDLFVPTYGLKNVNLSHNIIKDLPARIFQTTQLEILDLSHNDLTVIYEDALKLDTLQEIYLQNNKISLFEVKGVGLNTFPLRVLDVRDNRLVILDDDFIKTAKNLVTLKVEDNPWDCKCYEEMEILRGELSLEVSPEHHAGELPLCVIGNLDECDVNKNNVTFYYNVYKVESELP